MTFTNMAWAAPGSLLDLFLESFRKGDKTTPLLGHLVIVAVNEEAFRQCREVHPLNVGVNFTAEYMSRDYLEMMAWTSCGSGTRWCGCPMGTDIAISCNQFYGDDPYDLWKNASGGFLYVRPSTRTIAFFEGWYETRTAHRGQHDQYVFDKVKHELAVATARRGAALRRHGLLRRLLPAQEGLPAALHLPRQLHASRG
ncbi:hypothetical protein D1007_33147 [Hordeum vulgare]|nr:hypothetical protein D1007_33147 [Hordeum vulgare]